MPRETLVDFFADLSTIEGEFLLYDNGYRPQSFRYREIAGMARAFALRMRATGIHKGDKVLVWSENRPGWVGALWGCILDGIVLVPLDYRVSRDFLLRVATLVDAKALLVGDEVSRPADFAAPVWHLSEIEQQSAETVERLADASPDDTVQIVFTSGATAEPKGVVITHRNLLANMVPVEREIGKYKRYGRPFFPLRFLNLLPLSHLFGQSMATYIPPMLAGIVIFMKSLDPGEIVRQVRGRRISVVVCVPKMLEVLRGYVTARFPEVDAHKPGPWWIQWWRYRRVHRALGFKFWAFVVGAAPLDAELEQFWSRLGFLVIQGYGLTETAPIVTLNHPFHARKGTVGKPISGVEVKIEADGEILVRGPNVTSGYYQGPGAAPQATGDGWLHTGDLGELAPDGSLLVHGRKKDLIVTPEGLNVYPEDVERVLEKIAGVKEAAVVGPDRVHAILVLQPGASQDAIVNAANHELEDHQRIRTVHIWPGESLPRTEGTGKLKRVQLRDWLATGTPLPAVTGTRVGGVLQLLRKLAPGRAITPETTLEDLGLSSLERVELMSGIEQQLGGARDENAFAGARRVSDLLNIPAATLGNAENYPRWSRSLVARLWRRFILPVVVFPLTRYYARIEVQGRENFAGLRGPVILAANHQSYMDPPAIMAALPKTLRYSIAPAMSKEFFAAHFHPAGHTLYKRFIRGLQYYLAALSFNAFPIPQRESGIGGTLHYAGELAAEGWSILIFPEGEMTNLGEIKPFQPGVALMAARLSLPVVPVRIRGLDKVLHRRATHATRGRVQITFGPPIRLTAGDWRELARQLQNAVERL